EIAEQVEDGLGVVEMGDMHPLQAGMSVAVVAPPLLAVAEDFVRLRRFLELLFRFRIADVAVRVVLHGQLAVRFLDLLVVRLPRPAEDLVVVPLARHRASIRGQESGVRSQESEKTKKRSVFSDS